MSPPTHALHTYSNIYSIIYFNIFIVYIWYIMNHDNVAILPQKIKNQRNMKDWQLFQTGVRFFLTSINALLHLPPSLHWYALPFR